MKMHLSQRTRRLIYAAIRLAVFLAASVAVAHYLNERNYTDYFSKTLIKVHAETGLGIDAGEIARLLAAKEDKRLQELLDRNYNVFALVITDCRTEGERCDGQKILFSTDPSLYGRRGFIVEKLPEFPYVVLRRSSSSIFDLLETRKEKVPPGEIIGRVYSLSTIPTFPEDYRLWLRHPFRNNELGRRYLATTFSCLGAGVSLWLVVELFLVIRRIERRNAAEREAELMRDVDEYLSRLEENEARLKEQEERGAALVRSYIARIRELEQGLKDVNASYQEMTEMIITDMEAERAQQSARYAEELERTNREKESLRRELTHYRTSTGRERTNATRLLQQAMNPRAANPFERSVIGRLATSPRGESGEWLVMTSFDVGGGRFRSRFVDCIVVTDACLVVVEAKGYGGVISAEGDPANSTWLATDREKDRTVEVKGSWGVNPYHQVREYAMSLLTMVKRNLRQWQLPVYSLVVFEAGAEIGVGDRFGKFCRIANLDGLLEVMAEIDAEARRDHPTARRPLPAEVEQALRGGKT